MAKSSAKGSVLLIVLLAIALITVKWIKSCHNSSETPVKETPAWKDDGRNKRSEWRYRTLEYTQHARCRMQCRNISEAEVNEILRNGTINYKKSNLNDKPCPTYAIEGNTNDGQKVRIVFAACKSTTRVVTTIDLGVEHECDCN
ncbi:MAG: hypothetical protein FNNCIFGK_02344 [Bacteroidia bacterium]|nr:MAG: hypothetical protein UZ10_BCD003000648 [Bacteroidetes bacterium OLB10]MBV6455057.1 hypothetical protein [Bacteroidia bacterium]MBX3106834.1 DUF4258 domain-containing protein [Bacteroidota bacterium]MCB0849405.1 DUF4258 domain-containing protein [Bacteroidota bacterium]MCB8931573.1 DUF4258 domain-containing protein [Bacteroidia bacterium]